MKTAKQGATKAMLVLVVAGFLAAGCGGQRQPSETLKAFTIADTPLTTDLLMEGGAWRARCKEPRTIRLYEVSLTGVDSCRLIYRARLKTDGLQGRAFLEMWCRFPGRGEFFSKGLNNPLTGSCDWTTCETPFFLKAGEQPDRVRLNVVVEGTGNVSVRDVELLRASLPK